MIDKKRTIAKNLARYYFDGAFVNLGIGIPTLSADYIPDGMEVIFHAEGGFAGVCGIVDKPWDPEKRDEAREMIADPRWNDKENGWKIGHKDLNDAGGHGATLAPGSACFDAVTSFMIARGGHLDMTILGGLQVDEDANLANWIVPGAGMPGMGGAADLCAGAKRVIVAMEHNSKNGAAKILKKCTFPLTAVTCVSAIVTDLAVIEFIDGKLTVVAMAPGITKEELISRTEAELVFADNIEVMDVVEKED